MQCLLLLGVAITKVMFYSKIKEKYYNSQCMNYERILHETSYPNTLHIFVKQSIDQLEFVDIKISIAQMMPLDWDTIAREGAQVKFKEVEVEVVCSMDEFFNN